MIDFNVAYDKLAQFETPSEIAGFLKEQKVQAVPSSASNCAIARWMQNTTGKLTLVTCASTFSPGVPDGNILRNTEAMASFIQQFDEGCYPELIVGWQVK